VPPGLDRYNSPWQFIIASEVRYISRSKETRFKEKKMEEFLFLWRGHPYPDTAP